MERKYEIGRREAKRRLLWPVGALVLSATVGTLFGSAGSVDAERIWTLPDAIEFALESNPDSAIARERLLGAEAELEQAKAAYSPVVSVGSSYEATDGAGRAFGWIVNQRAYSPTMDFNRLGTIDNWNVHGMVSWTLYDGGRRSGMRDAAEASAEAAQAYREVARQDIAFGVVRSVLEIGRADEIVKGVEAEFAALGEAITVAEARVAEGALLESDALHLRVKRTHVEEELTRARHAASLSRRAFVNLLGLPYSEPRLEVGDVGELIQVPEESVPDRPELEAIRLERKASLGEVEAARAGKRPRVDLYGRVDRDEGWQTGQSGDHWSAGVAVTYDLWEGGSASGDIRAASARRRSAIEVERKVRLAIEDEVARARLALTEAETRMRVTGEAVALAEENVRLARLRFEQGTLLSNQLSEAEAGFTDAQVRRILAETDVRVSTAALRRALGIYPIVTQ